MAGMVGHAPSVVIGSNPEREKYEKLWGEVGAYRNYSPGEQVVMEFLLRAKPPKGASLIDFGCGTGRAGLELSKWLDVTLLDFAPNCLDPEVAKACEESDSLRFYEADLTREIKHHAAFGLCTDVMEHVPPDQVNLVLANILSSAAHVFFQISTEPDHFGESIGEHLHLTVEPMSEWRKRFEELEAKIHWSQDVGNACLFYVSAWPDTQELVDKGTLNTELEEIKNNIRVNIAGDYKQVTPHERQETEVMILGSGPSLLDFRDEIIANREAGMKLITTNGAYNQAIEWGLTPSAQIVVDARPSNARFVHPVRDTCLYLLASQVHPSLMFHLPRDNVYLWHACLDDEVQAILDDYYDVWWPIPGGSTVVLRSFTLLATLGYYKFHVYGFDSCIMGEDHHAFPQPENDDDPIIPVSVAGKVFRCTPWMASQAQEFIGTVRMLGDKIQLNVAGDGLIKHILKTGAKLQIEGE